MSIDDIKSTAGLLRAKIKDLDDEVVAFKDNIAASKAGGQLPTVNCDCSEAIASATLAHRHLEDARMRLGKTLQAIEGGTSIYDRPANPS